jgi:hypothetical protein
VIKVLVALRVPGVDVHELIQVHRRRLVELMQQYTHLKAEGSEHDLGLALVADAELFRLEAVVRWLDAADARLASLPAKAPAAAPAGPARRRRGLEAGGTPAQPPPRSSSGFHMTSQRWPSGSRK